MKLGRNISEIAQEVQSLRDNGKDFTVNTRAMEADAASKDVFFDISTDEGEEDLPNYKATDLAHGQIAAAAKIPKAYYDRMRAECPSLLAHNINHWWNDGDGKNRLVRTDARTTRFVRSSLIATVLWTTTNCLAR